MLSLCNLALCLDNYWFEGLSTPTTLQRAPSRNRPSQGRNTQNFLLYMHHVTRYQGPPNVRLRDPLYSAVF